MIKKLIPELKEKDNRILFFNIAGAFLIKGGALIVSLLTLPVFIRYFDNQAVLGVWYTVLSVITWILNFDLGIGNGLRNHLVISITAKDERKTKELISSAYIIIGGLVGIFVIVGYSVSSFINWNELFNISEELVSSQSLLFVVRCIFAGIMIQLFLRLISSILYALQKSAVNNFISLVISLLQLLFVLIVPSGSPEENLITLSIAYIFITGIPYFVATIIVFSTILKKDIPSIRYYRKDASSLVMGIGSIFFLCQILYMIIMNTNDFFITYFTTPENTVEYNIYNKLFLLSGTMISLILAPIWSMVTKAIAEKKFQWLQSLYKKAKRLSYYVILVEFLLVAILQVVINLWLGDNAIKVNYFYALIFAVWGSVFIYQSVLSTFACGTGRMKLQAWCYGIGVIFKIVFLFMVFQVSNSWIFVVVSSLLIMIPYCILQQRALSKYFNRMDESDYPLSFNNSIKK